MKIWPYFHPIINFLRVAIPAISLFGSAPTFFLFWVVLRLITSIGFSSDIYRCYDDYLYSLYQQFVLFFFENWINVKIYFHGDYEEIMKKKENVLYIANHQSSVDWIIANMLAVRQGSLGHIRYVLKNDLKWIPLYGFYFQQHGCIYVRRNDKGDLERVEKGISQIKSNGLPVWLVIFPEGTRYNPIKNADVIERSRQFAEKKGVIPFDNVLYPRTGAVVASINALKDKFNAVYDITVVYDNHRLFAPSMSEYLQGKIDELHIHIERINIESVPMENNERISEWLYQRFVVKDKLLKAFPREKGIRAESTLKLTMFSSLFFLLTTFFLFLTSQGRTLYLQICVFATPITLFWMHFFPPQKQD